VDARARDLLTRSDGSTEVVGEATVLARIDYLAGYVLTELSVTPSADTTLLIHRPVSAGFRAAVAEALPDDRDRSSLLHLLLDDMPGAALVSGYVMGREGVVLKREGKFSLQMVNMCAGWREGGTIVVERERHPDGMVPTVTGPVSGSVERPDDPLAWHLFSDPLPAHGVRRRRRLDVVAGDPVSLDVFFRDSHMSQEGEETSIHEYTVDATVDQSSMTFRTIAAQARALPWMECIEAADSGSWLTGRPLEELRTKVRKEFTGIETCTHLNDTLRSLEDAVALIGALDRLASS